MSRQVPPLISFSVYNNILISVKKSNFTLVFLKTTCLTNSGAEKENNQDEVNIFQDILQNLLNTSANNNVSP